MAPWIMMDYLSITPYYRPSFLTPFCARAPPFPLRNGRHPGVPRSPVRRSSRFFSFVLVGHGRLWVGRTKRLCVGVSLTSAGERDRRYDRSTPLQCTKADERAKNVKRQKRPRLVLKKVLLMEIRVSRMSLPYARCCFLLLFAARQKGTER